MKKELNWINYLKAFLIIFIVIGHTNTIFGKYFYIFHVASFFVLSGYLFKNNNVDYVQYVKKKFKNLMIPFICYNILFILLCYILSSLNTTFYLQKININTFYLFGRYFNSVDIAGALWFLPILFLTEIIFKFIVLLLSKYSENKIYYFTTIITLLFVLWGYTYYKSGETISYNFDLVFLSLFFFNIGFVFKKFESKINNILKYIFLIVSILVLYWFSTRWQFINWPTRSFPNIAIMFMISISGFYILYFISKLIFKFKYKFLYCLEYVGKNTIWILIFHFLSFRIIFYVLYLLKIVNIEQTRSLVPLYQGTIYNLFTAFFAIILSLVIHKLIVIFIDKTKLIFYKIKKN